MQRTGQFSVGLLWVALTFVSVSAHAIVNPYVDPITNRNMFALKPAPSAEDLAKLNAPPPEPLPKVFITGITTLMGNKSAMLRVQRPAKPPEPAKDIPLMLAEGSPAEEDVQVVEINVAAGTVRILNRGTPQLLDISKDSPKAAPAAAPAPAPGGIRPGIPIPAASGSGIPAPGNVPIPPRPVRGGETSNNSTSAPPFAGSGLNQAQAEAEKYKNLPSLEDQIVMIEVNRMRTQHLVDAGEQPPLPPTELLEEIQKEQQGQVPQVP
jgi:hypothetical protein